MEIYRHIKALSVKSLAIDFVLIYVMYFLLFFLVDVQSETFTAWYYDDPTWKSDSVIPFLKKELFTALWIGLLCSGIIHFYYKTSIFPKKTK